MRILPVRVSDHDVMIGEFTNRLGADSPAIVRLNKEV